MLESFVMADDIILSPEGFKHLQQELEEAKNVKRPKVQEDIREARSHGDLRENAAYDESKLNQARLESRIKDLEYILSNAKVVERPENADTSASIGSKVTVKDRRLDEEWEFTLVGSFEADPSLDLVSVGSPVGKALQGRAVGEVFTVDTPGGKAEYEILKLE